MAQPMGLSLNGADKQQDPNVINLAGSSSSEASRLALPSSHVPPQYACDAQPDELAAAAAPAPVPPQSDADDIPHKIFIAAASTL